MKLGLKVTSEKFITEILKKIYENQYKKEREIFLFRNTRESNICDGKINHNLEIN